MIRSILCPVDRSPTSLQAFDYAMALARWQGARLSLLEVVGGVDAVERQAHPAKTLKDDLNRVLASRGTSDVKVRIIMRKGNVVREILAQAKASRSDLVVIGTHGRTGFARFFLGSVASRVLAISPCPVLTVRGK